MFDGLIEAIVDFFRTVLWGIVEVFLFIVDLLWQIVLRIATLNVSSITDIGNWFLLISTTVVLFTIFKLCKIFVKFYVDEEYREKLNISKMITMLSLVSVLVTAIPIGYGFACYISSNAIENMSTFIPSKTKDLKISDILIQSGRVNMKDTNADLGTEIKMDTNFDINAKDDDGNYKYFPEFSNIFLMIIVAIACFFIFTMTALQIAQRLALLILKYLMAPYAAASIIDPEDNTFGSWVKMIVGDLIMNFMQIYGIYLSMFLCINTKVTELLGDGAIGVFAKILFFIGSLMAVMEIPSVVAQLTGGSGKGMMQSLQDLKSMVGVGKTMGTAAKAIGTGAVVGGIATAGSVANGMSTAKDAAVQGYAKGSNPFTGSAYAAANVVSSGARTAATGMRGRASNLGKSAGRIYSGGIGGLTKNDSGNSSNFNEPPTERQILAAEALGISNPESMSRGELSLAMQDAGADRSYWADSQNRTTKGSPIRKVSGKKTAGSRSAGISNPNSTGSVGSTSAGDSGTSQAFNAPPTEKQVKAATALGISDPESMSRGELSLAMQDAGADYSYWTTEENLVQDAARYYGIDTTDMNTDEIKQTLKTRGYKLVDTSNKSPKPVGLASNNMYRANLNKKGRLK